MMTVNTGHGLLSAGNREASSVIQYMSKLWQILWSTWVEDRHK